MSTFAATGLYVLVGLVFALLGTPLALRRVPPNWVYGFRTARTMRDPDVWYAANRIAGIDLVLCGLAFAGVAIGLGIFWRSERVDSLVLVDSAVLLLLLGVSTVHTARASRRDPPTKP